jgi:hypothetical protein
MPADTVGKVCECGCNAVGCVANDVGRLLRARYGFGGSGSSCNGELMRI